MVGYGSILSLVFGSGGTIVLAAALRMRTAVYVVLYRRVNHPSLTTAVALGTSSVRHPF